MPAIGTTITVEQQQQVRRELVTSPAALLRRVLKRHSDCVRQMQPEVRNALFWARDHGTDEARKASIEYVLDWCQRSVPTEVVLDREHLVWSELHTSTREFEFAA